MIFQEWYTMQVEPLKHWKYGRCIRHILTILVHDCWATRNGKKEMIMTHQQKPERSIVSFLWINLIYFLGGKMQFCWHARHLTQWCTFSFAHWLKYMNLWNNNAGLDDSYDNLYKLNNLFPTSGVCEWTKGSSLFLSLKSMFPQTWINKLLNGLHVYLTFKGIIYAILF